MLNNMQHKNNNETMRTIQNTKVVSTNKNNRETQQQWEIRAGVHNKITSNKWRWTMLEKITHLSTNLG